MHSASVRPGREDGPRRRSDGVGDATADEFWGALRRARAELVPGELAAAEDRVFRFYLPLARSVAGEWVIGSVGVPTDVERAAELGLARAVLGWPGVDSGGFQTYARAAITAELRRSSPIRPGRRDAGADHPSSPIGNPTHGPPEMTPTRPEDSPAATAPAESSPGPRDGG